MNMFIILSIIKRIRQYYVYYIKHVRCQLVKIENNKYNKKAETKEVNQEYSNDGIITTEVIKRTS